MTWTGGTPRAVVNVYSSEMTNQSVKLDPSADAKSIVTTPKGVYTWSLLGADGRPYAPSLVLTPGPGWVLDKDGRITVRGERGVLTDQYDVTASSTLDRDSYGVPCSPDNLKKVPVIGRKAFPGTARGNPGNQAQETRPAAGNHAGNRHFPGDRPGKGFGSPEAPEYCLLHVQPPQRHSGDAERDLYF
ncbi:hypothetical protein M5E88_18040 [Akkermansia muciniphila]|nr:hypothetical protein M5E88_18040 [Akkermansia muciniphila]